MASPSSAAAAAGATPPPPPPPVRTTFFRRIFPVLMIANVGLAVYIITRPPKRQLSKKDAEPAVKVSSPPVVVTEETTIPEKEVSTETPAPLKVLPPIPEHEQRELFKWILEEKRKAKPRDKLEKKKINEEKALLKEFIQKESIPDL